MRGLEQQMFSIGGNSSVNRATSNGPSYYFVYLSTHLLCPTYLFARSLCLSLSLSCTVDITLYSLNILIVLSLLLCEIYVVPIMSIHYNSLYVHTFLGYSSTLCLSVSL